jgi:superfamily II DNA or RNA helicase
MIKLLPFQEPHLPDILRQIQEHQFSLNASDTGTGKTYLTLKALEELGGPVLVAAPRGLQSMWKEALKLIDNEVLAVTSIEKLRHGNTPFVTKFPPARRGALPTFRWSLEGSVNLVFDEVHRANGPNSQNGAVFAQAKLTGHKVFALSATAIESPAKMNALGFYMGFHGYKDFRTWAITNGCFVDAYNNVRYAPHALNLQRLKEIHAQIFPEYGVRMKIVDIPDFPKNFVDVQIVDNETSSGDLKKYQEMYPEVWDWEAPITKEEHHMLFDSLAPGKPEKEISEKVVYLRKRQQAEFLKIATLAERIPEAIEEGNSVAVFFNFKGPLHALREKLKHIPSGVVTGDVSLKDRDTAVDKFQNNITHLLYGTHGAGGVGINLHDLKGRQRIAYQSPPLTSLEFKQTLGRVHRAGSLSASRQFILCLAKSIEDSVYKTLRRKVHQLHLIQDGDLAPEF